MIIQPSSCSAEQGLSVGRRRLLLVFREADPQGELCPPPLCPDGQDVFCSCSFNILPVFLFVCFSRRIRLDVGHKWWWQWVKVCGCCKQYWVEAGTEGKLWKRVEKEKHKTEAEIVATGTCPKGSYSLILKYERVVMKELLSAWGCVWSQPVEPDLSCFLASLKETENHPNCQVVVHWWLL